MAQKKKISAPLAKATSKPVTKKAAVHKSAPVAKAAVTKPVAVKPKVGAPGVKGAAQAPVKLKPAIAPVAAKVVKKIDLQPKVTAKPEAVHLRKAVPAAIAAKVLGTSAGAPQRAVPAAAHKLASQKLTAPVGAAVASPKAIAEKAAAARQMVQVQKKPVNQRHGFKANEFVVYPAHGVGRIVGIEEQEIAGMSLELFVITFDKEKLTLRVPTGKLTSIGMRKLADEGVVKKAMDTLKGRARIKRTMWSRRAQEYVAKINSGDLVSIAEVVRDLYRSEAQPEQSYSERQLYEVALERMSRELAAVEKLDERGAVQRITEVLSKSAKSRRAAEAGGEASVSEAA